MEQPLPFLLGNGPGVMSRMVSDMKIDCKIAVKQLKWLAAEFAVFSEVEGPKSANRYGRLLILRHVRKFEQNPFCSLGASDVLVTSFYGISGIETTKVQTLLGH